MRKWGEERKRHTEQIMCKWDGEKWGGDDCNINIIVTTPQTKCVAVKFW